MAKEKNRKMPESPPQVEWSLPPKTVSLTSNDIHIWRLDLTRDGTEAATWLDPTDQARLQKLPLRKVRQRFLASRWHLQKILANYLDCAPNSLQFRRSEHGKPSLIGADLAFNLTHSGDFGLLAVSKTGSIGIDVEPIRARKNLLAIAKRLFPANQVAELAKLDTHQQIHTFHRIWTAFEAQIKVTGLGIFVAHSDLAHFPLKHFSPKPDWVAAIAWQKADIAPNLHFLIHS